MNSKKANPWKEEESLEGYIHDLWKFLPVPLCYVNSLHFIFHVDSKIKIYSRGFSYNPLCKKI